MSIISVERGNVVSEAITKLVVNILFNIDSLEFSQMISSNHTAKLHDLAFSCRTLSSKKSWSSSQNASITGRENSSRSCFVHSNRSLKNFRTTSAGFNERCSPDHTSNIDRNRTFCPIFLLRNIRLFVTQRRQVSHECWTCSIDERGRQTR